MLVASPSPLLLLPTIPGRPTSGSVNISNHGQAGTTAAVTIDAPFTVTPAVVQLDGGASLDLTVSVTLPGPGTLPGVLHIGTLDVPVSATSFDPSSPCQVVTCDPTTGCVAPNVPDGSLCGPNDCSASHAQVCMSGACVLTPRPGPSRCVGRWLPRSIAPRMNAASAYVPLTGRTLIFGGRTRVGVLDQAVLGDTWEWNAASATWEYRIPFNSPSPRYAAAMAWDPTRLKMVLFGGGDLTTFAFGDTWEWDTNNWVKLTPANAPSARVGHSMTWDPIRKRVVLVGGISNSGEQGDVWEWDGTNWLQRNPATPLPSSGTYVAAWDEGRQRLVAVRNVSGPPNPSPVTETWEWDGTSWTKTLSTGTPAPSNSNSYALAWDGSELVLFGDGRGTGTQMWLRQGTDWIKQTSLASLPSERSGPALVWNPGRSSLTLFSGEDSTGRAQADVWEWNNAVSSWTLRSTSPTRGTGSSIVWDDVGQVVMLTGASGTWAWNDASWTQLQPLAASPGGGVMAWDGARHRAVLYSSQTWEWDGTVWSQKSPAATPPARAGTAMAWDPDRQRVVLFGGTYGFGQWLNDTWEWDGTAWTQPMPLTTPIARSGHAMAWDGVNHSVLLFGFAGAATVANDTWSWNGTSWTQQMVSGPQSSWAMTWDPARQRDVVFGAGATWEWDGASWTQNVTGDAPQNQIGGLGMTWDATHGESVIYDGQTIWVLAP